MTEPAFIRQAGVQDAAGISAIWQAIVGERDYSAVTHAFTPDEQRGYLQSLSPRDAIFVAEAGGQIVGFQTLDLWVRYTPSMDHVGQIGTFVLRDWRSQGIGRQLAGRTLPFARDNRYEKLVLFVRAKNRGAQAFYEGLGFVECGRFARHVKIGDEYDDEILMEMFL